LSGPVAVLGGTAGLGRALALRLAKAGCRVVIGSRSRERAESVAAEVSQKVLSNNVSGMLNEEAAAASRIVFFTVPYPGMYELARRIKGVLRPDSIVVSCVVPLESDLGGAADFVEPPDGSAAEALNRILNGDRVVSALTYVSAQALEELEKGLDCDIVVCGKKEYAQEVMSLLSGIEGARLLYAGDLRYSRVTERLTTLLIALNRRYGSRKAGVRFTNI
jgi:NADPH-dependent F420 reductase